jgi:hypothetical protein
MPGKHSHPDTQRDNETSKSAHVSHRLLDEGYLGTITTSGKSPQAGGVRKGEVLMIGSGAGRDRDGRRHAARIEGLIAALLTGIAGSYSEG